MSTKPSILEIADAVAEALTTNCPSICVKRGILPAVPLEDLATTAHIVVIPVGIDEIKINARQSLIDTVTVQVVLFAMAMDDEAVEHWMKVADDIATGLAFRRMADASFVGIDLPVLFDPDELNTKRLFSSVIEFKYMKRRDLTPQESDT